MDADKWTFLIAMCFICVSSNDMQPYEESCEQDFCETYKLSAPLGSSVLLSCHFETPSPDRVTWAHISRVDLVQLSSGGRIKFLDPRYGRVKAFPNQGSEGNYSICIDGLKNSDLGCYRCKQGDYCFQVEVFAKRSTLSDKMWLLIYICAGGAALLLSVCCYFCCRKCMVLCDKTQGDANHAAGIEGATAPPEAAGGRVPVRQQQRGADNNNLVYENDDQYPARDNPTRNRGGPPEVQQDPDWTQPSQSTSGIYPNLNQLNFEKVASGRTRQRFHIELFNRLRQASFSRHYYVNHAELNQQQAASMQAGNHHTGLKKKKTNKQSEYNNPIYNRSADEFSQL
ncbi:uncharacterized protein [Embiotoca jacksoni]|uniref:uncharacterized protein isoform X1 n=1 Tax=Embiotoca jacksoni TaxID=100190 RepID=UPI00370476A7